MIRSNTRARGRGYAVFHATPVLIKRTKVDHKYIIQKWLQPCGVTLGSKLMFSEFTCECDKYLTVAKTKTEKIGSTIFQSFP